MVKKLLYIGTGDHLEIVNDFPDVNEFICVDTKPRNEFDGLGDESTMQKSKNENTIYFPEMFRSRFFLWIVKKCEKFGFTLTEKIILEDLFVEGLANPTLLIFKHKERVIKYYISTNILCNMNDRLKTDMEESTGLIISGYFPNSKIVDYFVNKIDFYGYSETVYDEYEDDDDTIISLVNRNEKEFFTRYFSVNKNNSAITEVQKEFFFK
jgi:hypothetical protein